MGSIKLNKPNGTIYYKVGNSANHMVVKSWVNMPWLSSETSRISTFKETQVWITIYESIMV